VEACPKDMEYGPCGGVRLDGRCEVAEHACVFRDGVVGWRGDGAGAPAPHHQAAARMSALLDTRPIVVADLPARALDTESIQRCTDELVGHVDAVLAGDAATARVQFPPAYRAHLIRRSGLEVWTGFNNRDRNRVALEGELAALAEVGVAGVHCVTGDHTLIGSRPDAKPVFDLDSTRTASLARTFGHLVSVGESPAAPPQADRAARLRQKEAAGAEVCFVNHCGGPDAVGAFVGRARELGSTSRFIACVPVVVDRGSAELLATFTTLVLPDGYLEGILAADDIHRAGVAAAVELAETFLGVAGVAGVDLSGGPGPDGEVAYAAALAEVADAISLAGA
jgi:5,10-methylenetetrahydrofolate reductase